MRLSAESGLRLAERFFAAFVLFMMWPALAFLTILIRSTAGQPVFITDEWTSGDGRLLRACRFRSTGPGQPIFRFVGRIIRQHGFDDIPSLWNVACGEARLRDIALFSRR